MGYCSPEYIVRLDFRIVIALFRQTITLLGLVSMAQPPKHKLHWQLGVAMSRLLQGRIHFRVRRCNRVLVCRQGRTLKHGVRTTRLPPSLWVLGRGVLMFLEPAMPHSINYQGCGLNVQSCLSIFEAPFKGH